MTRNQAMRKGAIEVLPLVVGVAPFGIVTGIAGVDAGMNATEITLMSVWVYAGAAQLVSIQLMNAGAAMPLVVLASLVVNLRYIMYSSALAKPLEALSARMKVVAAFFTVDQNFALTTTRYETLGREMAPWYFLGGGILLWVNWVICTYLGALLGARVPQSWSLDFIVPLSFLVLMVPALRNRPSLLAALVGGLVATALAGLPYRIGLFVGAIAGIAAGVWLENRAKAFTPEKGDA